MSQTTIIFVIIALAVGAALSGIMDYLLDRSSDDIQKGNYLRDQLRKENRRLSTRVRELEEEVEEWKFKFYELQAEQERMRLELEELKLQLGDN